MFYRRLCHYELVDCQGGYCQDYEGVDREEFENE